MNHEQLDQVDLLEPVYDQPQQSQKLNIKSDAIDALDAIDMKLFIELRLKLEKMGFKGEKSQICQQNALIVLAAQITIILFITMVIQQIPILPDVWTFIPAVEYVAYFTFAAILISIQLLQEFCQQKRINFIIFILHSVSKISILSNLSLDYYELKVEILLLAIILIIIYVGFIIYIPTQRFDEVDLRLSQQILQFTLYNLFISTFLILFTRSDLNQFFIIFTISEIVGALLMTFIRRFKELKYLENNNNDIYLGAAQIDADLILPCWVLRYLLALKNNPQSTISIKQQVENQKSNSSSDERVQSMKSVCD